jgi:hypothetical protein
MKIYCQMEWANYTFLLNPNCFLITAKLHDLEMALQKDVPDSLHWSRRFEYPWVYQKLSPFSQDDVVLDAGAGNTVLQLYISPMVKEVHSVDLDVEAINWISKTKQEKTMDNVFPVVGDLTSMAFPSGYFDKVICISTLEHISKGRVTDGIDELIRVTKLGGRIAITMDVVMEKTDRQVDLWDFQGIAAKYSLTVPEQPKDLMVWRVPPYNFPFAVACIIMEVIK